jgi:hypothetical protein
MGVCVLKTVTAVKMRNTIIFVIGCLMLCVSGSPQERPRELKGDGHLLGETAEQFFSEGFVGDLQRVCQGRDWKGVKQLSMNADSGSKPNAKDICAKETLAKQQATSGARLEYHSRGDQQTMRAEAFTFDGGHLVKIIMVYTAPDAIIEGYDPKSFGELFAGLQEAYGPPSKSYSGPVLNVFGVKYDAHHAVWIGKQDVINIIERPVERLGVDGRTEIIAETLAEYNRAAQAPKTANPLQ